MKDQIRAMLSDTVDNTPKPKEFPTQRDFKREWLHTVADVANEMIRSLEASNDGEPV